MTVRDETTTAEGKAVPVENEVTVGGPAVESSRASRPRSFAVADFPMPTGREEEWRFTPLARLAGVLADERAEESEGEPAGWATGAIEWLASPLPAGVALAAIAHDDAVARTVQAPGDRASALAVALTEGKPLERAVSFAMNAAAITVTKKGAQPSIPYREDIDKL